MLTQFIIVKTKFSGTHNWPDGHPSFLQHEHHHDFYITVTIPVHHDDRELEILTVRDYVDKFVQLLGRATVRHLSNIVPLGEMSCERIASRIAYGIVARYGERYPISVEVLEDNEVGAFVLLDGQI